MIRIRPYQPGDAQLVCDLLTKYTNYKRDAAFWLWINRIWPKSNAIITVAEDDGVVVGHYAILPQKLLFDGNEISAGIGVHAFVAPTHRNKVPIFQISKRCHAQAKQSGIQLLWGFPNSNYRLIVEKVEGWRCVELFNAWEKPAEKKAPSKFKLETVDPDNSKHLLQLSDLLDSCSLGERIGRQPSLSEWIDRYYRHPQNEYLFHIVRSNGDAVAAMVTKEYYDKDTCATVGHLIDVAVLNGIAAEDLVSALEDWFSSRVDRLCWWPFNREFRAAMYAAGFKAEGFSTFFAIKLLDSNLESKSPELADILNWQLGMGMSDVF